MFGGIAVDDDAGGPLDAGGVSEVVVSLVGNGCRCKAYITSVGGLERIRICVREAHLEGLELACEICSENDGPLRHKFIYIKCLCVLRIKLIAALYII